MRRIVSRKSVVGYQALAALNGFALPVAVPLIFSPQASASVFQMYAIAVLLATIVDCTANSMNASGNSSVPLLRWSYALCIAWIFFSPFLVIFPAINLALSLSILYIINNMVATPGLSHLYPLPPGLQATSTVVVIIYARVTQSDEVAAFIAMLSICFFTSAIILITIASRSTHVKSRLPQSGRTLPTFKVIFEGIASRSIILITQNLLIAIAPLYLPPSDVVLGRVALSVQNMSRYFNLSPLSKFASEVAESGRSFRQALRIVAISTPLMIPAAFALTVYADLARMPPTSPWWLAAGLALSVFVPFTPHLILSLRIKRPIALLFGLSFVGGGCLFVLLNYARDLQFMGVYVAISWALAMLVLGFAYVDRRDPRRKP